MAQRDNFFSKLTRLFRSGPAIQKRIKGQDYKISYDKNIMQTGLGYRGPIPFGRESSPFSMLGNYGILDRTARYIQVSEMEQMAEIGSALDLVSHEVCSTDEKGRNLHIFSDNAEIKKALSELFFDTINSEFNLRPWVRNLLKYGDFFLYNEVVPDIGIVNCIPLPVNEIVREEGYDPNDPAAVRFKWLTRGNKILENWQVCHFRILENDLFLPYGSSILEPARRIFTQLSMMEDSMLAYRVVRSPERRVFYIDVGNTAPNDIPNYMNEARAALRSNVITDKQNGRIDYRHRPIDIFDDYFIPRRGETGGTKIETLAGGQHVSAIEDVEYLQKKLFAALKIPKAFLGYSDELGSKATLSQLDIRFSRTVSVYQKIIIAELNKLAMIHLFAKGFDGEDLVDYELYLSNPSSVALQQKLALWNDRIDIAAKYKESGLVDEEWIHKEILEFTHDEIDRMKTKRKEDVLYQKELEAIAVSDENQEREAVTDPFDPSSYAVPGADVPKTSPNKTTDELTDEELTSTISRFDNDGNVMKMELPPNKNPVQATPYATRRRRNEKRRVGMGGRFNLNNPDFARMLDMSGKNPNNNDVTLNEDEMKKSLRSPKKISYEMQKMLNRMNEALPRKSKKGKILIEVFDEKLDKMLLAKSEDEQSSLKVLMEANDTKPLEIIEDSKIEKALTNLETEDAEEIFGVEFDEKLKKALE